MFNTDKFAFFSLFFFPKAREAVSKLFPTELQEAEKWSWTEEMAVISSKPK